MITLITGVAGAGKTTIAAELTKLGYDALDMDSTKGLCAWVNLSTGKPDPNFVIESASDWDGKYDWLWDDAHLRQMLSETRITFFCGSSGNQERFYSLFDKVFLLEMDNELIKDRIFNSHREHDYGRKPGELDLILDYYKDFQERARAFGAVVIDASKPIDTVIDEILSETSF